MPLTGSIKTFSLSAIVRLIHTEAKTGVLKVTRGENTAGLYFKNGEIVFISGELTQDLSLSSLLKAGKITSEENIQKSLEIARTTGKRLETVLLEQGYIPQNKLANILRYQFKEVLANVLTWDEGEFNYTDGAGDDFEDLRLKIDPIRLMADAQKWREYRSLIPNDQAVFQIKAGIKPDSLSGDRFSRVMLLINGQRNVAQIIAETGLSRLAVYSALTALASRGAIVRPEAANGKAEADQMDDVAVIKLFLNILAEITAGLAVELGRKKAAFLFEKSLKRNPYYDLLFCDFRPEADSAANVQLINNHLHKQRERILKKDLINGFNLAMINLLQEEYQLLGLRAVKNTVNRLNTVLELVPHSQKYFARTVSRSLIQCCEDEELLQGNKHLSATMNLAQQSPSKGPSSPPHNLNSLGGATIIAFYSKVIQMLMRDLKNEVGAKALDLLANILMRSEYYDTFLSQFDIQNSIGANVERIQEHIRTQGHKLGKQGMVRAFQLVLLALMQEEKRLLGDKYARMSLIKLKEHLADPAQKNYSPLADHLVAFLQNNNI